MNNILEGVKRLKAIADIGLLYSKDNYDKERYEEIKQTAFYILQTLTGVDKDTLLPSFPTPHDYPTAKVDIRGILLSLNNEILLVKESADNKWSLPGGWADVGHTPSEVIVKEFKEETGLDVEASSLLAVFDKRVHQHPPQPFYVYKMVFHCKSISDTITKGFDVLDAQFFPINNLPPLSEDRILKSQLELVYKMIKDGNSTTYFD